MKKIIYIIALMSISLSAFSQSVAIDDVKGNKFTGVQTIWSGIDGTIDGYYTYYMVENPGKGLRVFEFALIDKDITKITKVPITMHKYANITNTVFNGKFFLVAYSDIANSKSVTIIIDVNGQIIKTDEVETTKKYLAVSTIFPGMNGDGFYIVRPEVVKPQFGYTITKVDNDLKEIWKETQMPESSKGNIALLDLINTGDKFVIWQTSGVGAKIKPSIVAFDAKTGKKIYKRDGYDGTSTILYNQLRVLEDGSVLAGGAYSDGEYPKSVNNTGIYFLKINEKGEDVIYTKINNIEQIQKTLAETSKGGGLGSKDKVYVEDLVITKDGFVVVSEMFSKNINATPAGVQWTRDLITGKYIGERRDEKSTKMVFEIKDFILFSFNTKGELAEIKPITKDEYNKLTVWSPYDKMGGQALAKIIDGLGWFDYAFTTSNEAGERVMVCANNAKPKRPEVYTYGIEGDYTKTQKNLKQEAKIDLEKAKVSYFKILRNEKGKMALAYYQRKLKRITINLEDL